MPHRVNTTAAARRRVDRHARTFRPAGRLSPRVGEPSQIAARAALEAEYQAAGADALAQFAEDYEVAETTIWRWRTGRSRLPRRVLRRLATAA